MKKDANTEITMEYFYKEEGTDIVKILTDSVILFIESEVQKLCTPK